MIPSGVVKEEDAADVVEANRRHGHLERAVFAPDHHLALLYHHWSRSCCPPKGDSDTSGNGPQWLCAGDGVQAIRSEVLMKFKAIWLTDYLPCKYTRPPAIMYDHTVFRFLNAMADSANKV